MLQLQIPPLSETKSKVAVLAVDGELRALAARAFRGRQEVLHLEGDLVAAPTRYTIQLGMAEHLEMPSGTDWQTLLHRYPWRYLNHGCQPNTRIVGRSLVALVDIPEGTELTFDYESNELELAEPFPCRCRHCDGHVVRGFRHLEPAERAARHALLPEHLLAWLDSEPARGTMAPAAD